MSAQKKKQELPTADNVDQIREIIFGGVMRDYDARFKNLSGELGDTAKSLRSDFEARLDALAKRLEREAEKATQRLEDEAADRVKALKSLTDDMTDGQGDLGQSLKQLNTRLDDEADTLRHEIETLRTQLLDRINEEMASLRERLNTLGADLDARKVGREELAGLLTEVALRLKGELSLPDGD